MRRFPVPRHGHHRAGIAAVVPASARKRAGKLIAAHPYDVIERGLDRRSDRHDPHHEQYAVTDGCEPRIHALIGADWPCDERNGFDDVWSAALDDLASRGLQVGRATFGEWDDGDIRLAQVAWCLTRHLQPEWIVETGVARGLLTRVLLEALECNGLGRLWSIDLPPLLVEGLADQTAAAVPERLEERWTLLRGTSRRRLPSLVAALGRVGLFVHDSSHTTRNVRFELEQVWPALPPGGAALIDDVEKNAATAEFLQAHPNALAVISTSSDGNALIGCLIKPLESALS